MTVYVDSMRTSYRRMIMCHMIADTDTELRTMAALIGVAQRHHQGDHFDICLAMRALAVKAGAVEITWKQAGCMMMRRKVTGELGLPGDAIRWARDRFRALKRVYGGKRPDTVILDEFGAS